MGVPDQRSGKPEENGSACAAKFIHYWGEWTCLYQVSTTFMGGPVLPDLSFLVKSGVRILRTGRHDCSLAAQQPCPEAAGGNPPCPQPTSACQPAPSGICLPRGRPAPSTLPVSWRDLSRHSPFRGHGGGWGAGRGWGQPGSCRRRCRCLCPILADRR